MSRSLIALAAAAALGLESPLRRRLEEALAAARTRCEDAKAQRQTLVAACATLRQSVPTDEKAFTDLYAVATTIVDAGAKVDTRRLQEAVAKQAVLKAPQPVEKGQEIERPAVGAQQAGSGYDRVGEVFRDPKTGKLVLIEPARP